MINPMETQRVALEGCPRIRGPEGYLKRVESRRSLAVGEGPEVESRRRLAASDLGQRSRAYAGSTWTRERSETGTVFFLFRHYSSVANLTITITPQCKRLTTDCTNTAILSPSPTLAIDDITKLVRTHTVHRVRNTSCTVLSKKLGSQ